MAALTSFILSLCNCHCWTSIIMELLKGCFKPGGRETGWYSLIWLIYGCAPQRVWRFWSLFFAFVFFFVYEKLFFIIMDKTYSAKALHNAFNRSELRN